MKFVTFIIGEGKNKLVTPFIKWFSLAVAGRGCYDYGRFEIIKTKGENMSKTDAVEMLVVNKFQNLLKWIIEDNNFIIFIKATINNISYKLNLPIKVISYILILLSISFIIYLFYRLYRYIFKNKKNKTYVEEVVDSFSDQTYKYLNVKAKESASQFDQKLGVMTKDLEEKINVIKSLESKMIKELEKKNEVISDLQNKSLKEVEKKDNLIKNLQIKGKTLQTAASKKEKMIKDLKNKMKKLQVAPKSRSRQRKNNIILK